MMLARRHRDARFRSGRRIPPRVECNFAEVWQFAQSPQRKDVGGRCTNYSRDGECYPPGLLSPQLHVDVNSATSADPSHGRTR
jgi:hypothetical protein